MQRLALALALVIACLAATSVGGQGRLEGHGGPVMDVAVSPAGQVATASFDNAVGLWADGEPRWLDGHEAAVNAVLFLDGDRLASAGDDFAVAIWDIATGDVERLSGHRGKVAALAIAPDGMTLASASWDGTIGLWTFDGASPRFLRGHGGAVNDVAFAPDGRLYSASADGTVRVWDPNDGTGRTIVRHGFGVNRILLGEGWLAYGAVDGTARLVSVTTEAVIADLSAGRRPILAMARSASSDLLAIGDGEGYILVADLATGAIRHDFRAVATGPVWALAFGPDDATLYSAGLDPAVTAWAVADLGRAREATTGPPGHPGDPDDMENGERKFLRKCSICHSLTPGTERRAGPSLHGLFGRPAGSVRDYIYSDRLARGDIVWTPATVDALFDEGPDHFVPGSKMPMQRISRAEDRADLIAYLQTATRMKGTAP